MIFQHTCPICGTSLDAEQEIAALRARLEALEAVQTVRPTPTPAKVITLPRAARRAATATADYRSAADVWLAGEVLQRPKKAEYRKGISKPVVVTFADGEIMRVSTYLDGQAGLNSAAQHARTVRQSAPPAEITYPFAILYDDIARGLGCVLVEREPGLWSWTGPENPDGYESSSLQAVVMEMCMANGRVFETEMRTAQMASQAWADATRAPGTWVRDSRGCWRLVQVRDCPPVLAAEYAEDDALLMAAE